MGCCFSSHESCFCRAVLGKILLVPNRRVYSFYPNNCSYLQESASQNHPLLSGFPISLVRVSDYRCFHSAQLKLGCLPPRLSFQGLSSDCMKTSKLQSHLKSQL